MAMPEHERRQLIFHNLDEVVADVDNLRAKGYDKAGNWNLAQISSHLAAWIRFATDGYPRAGCFMGQILWLMRFTVGRRMLRTILREGKMTTGAPTMNETVPPPDAD